MANFSIDHVGFITDDIETFESFWCSILGYELLKETKVDSELAKQLFHFKSEGTIRRYRKEGAGPDIEIHLFSRGSWQRPQVFQCFGINHVCLHTGGPGSRGELISTLPENVRVLSYNNPKGWINYFIQDYEGNWIELRERL